MNDFYIADSDNFIQNKFGYCFYSLDKNVIIFNLYVHPEYRQQGKARKLLQYIIREIREDGYEGEISIEANQREDSIILDKLILFYKSMGLKII